MKVFAATLRDPVSAPVNRWGAVFWAGSRRHETPVREIAVLDRVGGRDGYVSGLAWAFLTGLGPQAAVDHGTAHGSLAMTRPGDNAMTSLAEVVALVMGGRAAAVRQTFSAGPFSPTDRACRADNRADRAPDRCAAPARA